MTVTNALAFSQTKIHVISQMMTKTTMKTTKKVATNAMKLRQITVPTKPAAEPNA